MAKVINHSGYITRTGRQIFAPERFDKDYKADVKMTSPPASRESSPRKKTKSRRSSRSRSNSPSKYTRHPK